MYLRWHFGVKELPDIYKKLLVEFSGTFYMVLTVALTSLVSDGLFSPIAVGFMVTAQVFAYGYLSGAQYNPAVTAAMTSTGLMEVHEAGLYVIAQLCGSTSASLLGWFLAGDSRRIPFPVPKEDTPTGIVRAFLCEFVFTMCLVSVAFNVACSRQKNNSHYGLAIGLTVMAGAFSVGGISGAAFNPATATGLQIAQCVANDCSCLKHLWIYWVAPTTAALAAAVQFCLVHPTKWAHLFQKEEEEHKEALLQKSFAGKALAAATTGDDETDGPTEGTRDKSAAIQRSSLPSCGEKEPLLP